MDQQTELLIVGGGPAGYAAAIRGRQLGKNVVLVEKSSLGGTCLNRGCIPTKSLLESAGIYQKALAGQDFGINCGNISVDYPQVAARKDQVVDTLVTGLQSLLKHKGVQVISGEASFLEEQLVKVETDDGTVQFRPNKVIVATGTTPRQLPGLKPDGQQVLDSDQLLALQELPSSLVIVGGGVIGCEFATVFSSFGVDVTVVELTKDLIPTEDQDISKALFRELKKAKVKVLTEAKVTSLDKTGAELTVNLEHKGKAKEISCERVLVSVGRKPLLPQGLNPKLSSGGYIEVDECFATDIPNVYAAGDIIGGLQLAHLAFEEGMAAAEFAFGNQPKAKWQIPRCVYTHPEIGCVGLTEEQAKTQYSEIQVGKYWLKGNGKAMILGENSGFCKVVAADNRVVGVHIIGPHATELIAEGVAAIERGFTLEEWAQVVHPHPTVSESVKESILMALGRGLHS